MEKECGMQLQRKGSLEPKAEAIEEGEDKLDAEMFKWIEIHKADILGLCDGEVHMCICI